MVSELCIELYEKLELSKSKDGKFKKVQHTPHAHEKKTIMSADAAENEVSAGWGPGSRKRRWARH
jgi:hypothetical protein